MIRRLVHCLTMITFLVSSIGIAVFFLFFYYGRGLPDYDFLLSYEPPALNRIQAKDGGTLREFALERRIYATLDEMPPMLVTSFLAAEDKNFYYHCGLDLQSILRAIVSNSTQGAWLSRPLGGSTITQQVAKNFLVGNERSFDRKAKEAIMSLRLESALTKDRILELYLNQIYLGMGAYGVVAAAETYFNKSLDQLSLAEMAFLAAMPKAPSFYPNKKDLSRAKARRNWVIDRLEEEGVLTTEDADKARDEPLVFTQRSNEKTKPDYFTEYIRQNLASCVGEDDLQYGGLTIKTTLDPKIQALAMKALRKGLNDYDRRHGWRGPLDHIESSSIDDSTWHEKLKKISMPPGIKEWDLALVLEVTAKEVKIGLHNGEQGSIPLQNLLWAQKNLPDQTLGPPITHPEDVLAVGDIILVSQDNEKIYRLEQIPEVTGGLVVLDPHTGEVFAMVGGFDFEKSQFNCATQAERQPGSSFKPFVYLTALEHGYTPETRVLDAPIMFNVGGAMGVYAPQNMTKKFYGPTPLRVGLIRSRNVMTVRLAQQIGIKKVEKTAKAFGLMDKMPHQLAMALGAGETTLLKLTTAYGMIANGGFYLTPKFIKEVVDRHDQIIYQLEPDEKVQIADPKSISQLVSILRDVIRQGTASSLSGLAVPIAGKTGTTNDYKDAWFVGFTPDMVVGVFVGFPTPKTLGPDEQGSRVALPIFKDFMVEALKDVTPQEKDERLSDNQRDQ